jgi:hypothetical protein
MEPPSRVGLLDTSYAGSDLIEGPEPVRLFFFPEPDPLPATAQDAADRSSSTPTSVPLQPLPFPKIGSPSALPTQTVSTTARPELGG